MPDRISISVGVSNFGPFRDFSVDVKPLTVFVGRNSTGKSMVMYLLWTLLRTLPAASVWLARVAGRCGREMLERAVESLRRGIAPPGEMMHILRSLVEEFPDAWADSISDAVRKVFGVSKIGDLANNPELPITIRIRGKKGSITIAISDEKREGRWESFQEDVFSEVSVESPGSMVLTLGYRGVFRKEIFVMDVNTLLTHLAGLCGVILSDAIGLIGNLRAAFLMVDGRARLIRTLLKPYPEIAVTIGKTIPFADTLFIESMYALIRSHRDGKVDLSHPAVMSFLNEIGVKEITVEEEAYAPRVYIRTWTGHKMPLERAPSGMREILAILFALFSKDAPAVLLVEEPEAHLHPRALLYLARVIAVSVNRFGKNVILSTHSDVLVAEVNNLIAVSSKPEKMSKLGYSKDEVLDPGAVAAYLIKPEETTASVVELKTTETGFDESIFEEVARELMERRAEALE